MSAAIRVLNPFARLSATPLIREALLALTRNEPVVCSSVANAAQSSIAALFYSLADRPTVVVCDGVKRQEQVHQDLETWSRILNPAGEPLDELSPLFFPAWEVLPHETKLPHVDVISERLETLGKLLRHPASPANHRGFGMLSTTVAALMQKTFQPAELATRAKVIHRGDSIDPLDLIEWLEDQGYEPEVQVSKKGEVASRGGIIDVFPPTNQLPVRIEFFGAEVESMRHFDPTTQVSEETLETASICPAGELGLLRRAVQAEREKSPSVTDLSEASAERFGSLLDYLPPGTLFVLLEPDSLDQHAQTYATQIPEGDALFMPWAVFLNKAARSNHVLLMVSEQESEEAMAASSLPSRTTERKTPQLSLNLASLELYRPITERSPDPQISERQRRTFLEQLHRWLRQGYEIHVFCNNEGERQRFHEIWSEQGFDGDRVELASSDLTPPALPAGMHSRTAPLGRGFLCDTSKTVIITDAEIFGRYKVQRLRRLKIHQATASRSMVEINFSDLDTGDFVVHLQHGIGKYLGLQYLPPQRSRREPIKQMLGEEGGQECLVIEFAPSDLSQPAPKLYVPVTEAHLVSKYIGAGKARPPLNTLGGGRWHKTKEQAQHAVRDLASELLAIQAARESQTGHAFGADTPWQREFEGAFLYEETPDQLRAIAAAKTDMESTKPMDRLICGDVGFGKTEVAIRAAFKAVMGGKQVALLVPTTVLAQQHYNTLRDRMADYPVRVDLLSRFRSPKQQRQTLVDLASGSVDIVVGTHRLVQPDVDFKDLGLVIIDEEQRFGVMHKERFKLMRRLVEVLTLSATPIPRTLYLALSGARDLSTIETPPQDRLPVETVLAQYDERLIRDAIQRELNREGQVYFLHNRVSTIDAVALKLRALVPHARILVGHGQMPDNELEDVMTQFVNGEADVLLCTTIIESGLDIPNANTLIIDRADRFGLSELYQLRGRVGRYKHQAYAYLFIPRHAGLLSDARKRLSAIKQYSSLGSGFKIAMRDLELRGAGNLLGPQQSGHIAAIGFELYCQLLKQSIGTLRGEKVKPRIEVALHIDFLSFNPAQTQAIKPPDQPVSRSSKEFIQNIEIPREVAIYRDFERTGPGAGQEAPAPPIKRAFAYLPPCFITEPQHRIEMYRKLAQCFDKEGLEAVKKEVRDRFGPLPPAVDMLFLVNELRMIAAEKHIEIIETKEDRLMLKRNNDWILLGGKFPRLTKREPKARLGEIRRLLLAL